MNSQIYQTNTFLKGLNLDADISMIGSDQYRYAENIRLLTNDNGTTGVLQGVENIEKLTLTSVTQGETVLGAGEIIIGVTSVKEYGVVFTKDYTDNKCYNRVWRLNFTNDKKVPVCTCVLQGYFDIENKLSLVTHYTSDTNIKVYFADGVNLIRTVNIMLVIPYSTTLNIGSLDIIPSATLPPLDVVGLGVGSLPSGTIQYCYQLFNIYGNESSISTLGSLVPLSNSNLDDVYSYGQAPNKSSNKSVMLKADLMNAGAFNKCRIMSIHYSSNTAIPTISIVNEIEIGVSDTVIYYEDKGNGYLSELTVEEFNALVDGQFAPVSIEKMNNRLFASNIKDLTWDVSNYDTRVYRANSLGSIRLESSSDDPIIFNATNIGTQNVPYNFDCINPFNALKSSLFTSTNRYEYKDAGVTIGGIGKNISYEIINTKLNVENVIVTPPDNQQNSESDTITGYKVADSAELKTNSILGNALRIYKNTGLIGSIQYAPVAYSSKKNYSDPIIASKFRGYQRDEVYRFGIIFYNDKNIPSPVHWISDIRMPHAADNAIFESSYSVVYGINKTYTTDVKPLGVRFTINNLPDGVHAYEIVRCQRTISDRTVLMQGALSNTIKYQGNGTAGIAVDIRPYPYLSYSTRMNSNNGKAGSWNEIGASSEKAKDYYTVTSPEVCYNKENAIDLLVGSVYLDTICGLASPVNRWRAPSDSSAQTYRPAIMHSLPKIKNISGNIEDVSGNDNYYLAGERYDYPGDPDDATYVFPIVNVSTGTHSALISRYLYPFYNADIRSYHQDASNFINISKRNASVTSIKYATPMLWNNYSSGDILANGISIGEKIFHNWSVNFNTDAGNGGYKAAQKHGPHGYCFIMHSPELGSALANIYQIDSYTADAATQNFNRLYAMNSILIANLKQNVVQYGGNTYTSIQNSVYISTGTYTKSNTGIVNCFGGDTYIDILDYTTTSIFSQADTSVDQVRKGYFGAYIPFESSINFAFKRDQSFSNTYINGYADAFLQNKAGQFLSYKVQDLDPYTYNGAYSSQPGNKKYVAKGIYDLSNIAYTNRITCSEVKSGNDIIDKWTKFKFANYIDVDTQYGNVTNLKAFNNKLYYWQDDAFGVTSVNERSLIQDNNLGALTLGTGGILVRYDNISTNNGDNIKNDSSIVKSDTTIYWYDFNNNEIVAFGNDIHSLSKVKSVQSYFNELPEVKRNNVVSYYDKKYNEIVFKIYDKALVFNEQLQYFTCFYTIDPEWILNFANRFYSISNRVMYLHNTTDNLSEQTYPAYTLDDGSYADINISKIQFLVNKDFEYTKTFDNVFFNGDLIVPTSNEVTDTNVMKDVWFKTKNQETIPILQADIDNREDTYRFAIGREKNDNAVNNIYNNSFLSRMKGKYLICNYSFDCRQGKSFRIPSIRTTYRYSLV